MKTISMFFSVFSVDPPINRPGEKGELIPGSYSGKDARIVNSIDTRRSSSGIISRSRSGRQGTGDPRHDSEATGRNVKDNHQEKKGEMIHDGCYRNSW
jgi:hypothetical protein